MKKLFLLALVFSVSVETNGWLVFDFPSTVDDAFPASTPKPHHTPIRQESRTWDKDPTLALWGPDSSYSRVPGKRSTSLPMSSWGPDSSYSRIPGKRFAPLLMSTWRPDSGYSRVLGKRESSPSDKVQLPWQFGVHMPMIRKRESSPSNKVQLPWQFDVHMPMIHKRGGLNIWGLDRTIVLPWKLGMGQSGKAIFNSKKWGPKSTKEAAQGQEEELGEGALTAMLPWGMSLQSPMLRGKKAYLPLSMHMNMLKNQADDQLES